MAVLLVLELVPVVLVALAVPVMTGEPVFGGYLMPLAGQSLLSGESGGK